MGQVLTKTVFLRKISHIPLNYAFLLFWSIFRLIHCKLHFLFKKVTISERSTEILRRCVFFNKFEKGQYKRKIWIYLDHCFEQTSKRGQILTKIVFLPKVSHRAKLWFSVFWSIFGLIHWKLLFLDKNVTILERSPEILRKFVFLNKFENGKILRKIWICLNYCFW